ncbi:MAG: Na(+)/H(+) antiporter NhaA [Actinomycetota bacterium]|nr:MAG: Na(+)/H(+) antiporter NhaA [Actinomycetota bacterium]
MAEHHHLELRAPWSRSDRYLPRTILRPLQDFLETSTASGVVMLVAVVVALAWANSPWGDTYERFWGAEVSFALARWELGLDLRHWVNEGAMTIFFLLVGLEIKRELTTGELRNLRTATLPIAAAIGGMVVPAGIYLALNAGGPGEAGWGIPMATDIAFALGVLTLAAKHAPSNLKPLLLTLAIADDIGAIIVIALFYGGALSFAWLEAAAVVLGVIVVARRIGVRAIGVYGVLGAVFWLELHNAGIHPTMAGVVLGLLAPAVPFQRPAAVSREARRMAEQTSDDVEIADEDAPSWLRLAALSREAISPLARTEHTLLPWSSFVIVPIFALANAGVRLSGESVAGVFSGTVALGVFLGLTVGKPLGIWLASTIAVRTGIGALPSGVRMRHVALMGVTAGIGFTVSLFIAELAFAGAELLDEAKLAILAASLVAGAAALLLFRATAGRRTAPDPASAPVALGARG